MDIFDYEPIPLDAENVDAFLLGGKDELSKIVHGMVERLEQRKPLTWGNLLGYFSFINGRYDYPSFQDEITRMHELLQQNYAVNLTTKKPSDYVEINGVVSPK